MSQIHRDVRTFSPGGVVVSRLDFSAAVEPNRPQTSATIGITSVLAVPCTAVIRIDKELLAMLEEKNPFVDGESFLWTEQNVYILVQVPTFKFVERPRACNKITHSTQNF